MDPDQLASKKPADQVKQDIAGLSTERVKHHF